MSHRQISAEVGVNIKLQEKLEPNMDAMQLCMILYDCRVKVIAVFATINLSYFYNNFCFAPCEVSFFSLLFLRIIRKCAFSQWKQRKLSRRKELKGVIKNEMLSGSFLPTWC